MKRPDKSIANYTLRSKDIPLISFSLLEDDIEFFGVNKKRYSIQINKIYNENHKLFPKNMLDEITDEKLLNWIDGRKVPKNRRFVEKILFAFD